MNRQTHEPTAGTFVQTSQKTITSNSSNSFLMRESGPDRGAFCFAKSCLEGSCVWVYVCAREKKKNNFQPRGENNTMAVCPSVCLSVCLSARPNNPADSSPFHHLGTKLQTKTCAQQVTFCPSCPNRYLCNPWSVSRDSTPFVQIYMSHGRIPDFSAGRRHFVFFGQQEATQETTHSCRAAHTLLLDRVRGQGGRDTHTHTCC